MAAKNLFGVIYMSTAKLEMLIVSLKPLHVVEHMASAKFVQRMDKSKIYQSELGKIIFSLQGFRQVLKDYGVKRYHFWASQQLIDDVTARYLAEQIEVRTGLAVTWLSTSQINFLRATALMGGTKLFHKIAERSTYLLSIGSVAATLSHFNHGHFVHAWNIGLGYLEIDQLTNDLRHAATDVSGIISDYISSKLQALRHRLEAEGREANLILQDFSHFNDMLLQPGEDIAPMTQQQFQAIEQDNLHASQEYLRHHFKMDETAASRVIPSLLMIRQIISMTHAGHLYLTRLNILNGLALHQAAKDGFLKTDFDDIIRTVAENRARRYQSDDAHRAITLKLALHLYDQLRKLHRLGQRERLLLEIGVRLEDLGNFIQAHGHYRHSAYIIEANPVIGLSDDENEIIAEIARYHSAEAPEVRQHHYSHLGADIQMTVAKLVAIVRLADAMDDSRQQKIKSISVSVREDAVTITAHSMENLALEEWAFQRKAKLFREVYGISAVLKQRRSLKK